MAARHQWVRGWCRHRALEHIEELLELQAEQGIGLVEVVTKLGITLKKGLRYSGCIHIQYCLKPQLTMCVNALPSFVYIQFVNVMTQQTLTTIMSLDQ